MFASFRNKYVLEININNIFCRLLPSINFCSKEQLKSYPILMERSNETDINQKLHDCVNKGTRKQINSTRNKINVCCFMVSGKVKMRRMHSIPTGKQPRSSFPPESFSECIHNCLQKGNQSAFAEYCQNRTSAEMSVKKLVSTVNRFNCI